jgi:CheY-like chemotaxis protein
VDDEPNLVLMAALMLQGGGHTVVMAHSAEEALEKLTTETFDVVISDLGMGLGMSGWDLADQVKQRWPHVRFVLATGWGAQIRLEDARLRGVHAVVTKPYRAEDLEKAATGT